MTLREAVPGEDWIEEIDWNSMNHAPEKPMINHIETGVGFTRTFDHDQIATLYHLGLIKYHSTQIEFGEPVRYWEKS